MKAANAIKKLEKLGTLIPNVRKNYNTGEEKITGYHMIIKNEVLSFIIDSDNDISCIHTKGVKEETDSMTDYFPGSFHKNLSQALKFIQSYC